MNLHTILFVVLVGCSVQVFGGVLDDYYGHTEPDCSSAGGSCILKSECEPEKLASNTGLCPKQQSQGFECCHGVPISENRCKKFGGDCFNTNYCRNPFLRATDCGAGKECCILL